MANLGGITKPVTDVAQKAAKAGKIKSLKIKLKFDSKAKPKQDANG